MKRIKAALVILLMVFAISGCGIKNSNAGIIKVNNTVITQNDFDAAFNQAAGFMLKSLGIDAKKDPSNIMVLTAKDQVTAQLIVSTILNSEMDKYDIKVSKSEIDAAEEEAVSRFASKEQFKELLKANGASYEDFRKNLEQEIRIKKYVDSISMVSIGDSEAEKYYKKNPAKFEYPEQVRASHILISANLDAEKAKLKKDNKDLTPEEINTQAEAKMSEARDKAEALRAEAEKNPSSFAELAKKNSQDKISAVKGGDLGFFTKDEMTEEFSKAAFSLKPETISGVIKTPYGYHIIMVTDRKEAGKYTFEETKKDIKELLENQEKMKIFKNKIAELSKSAHIEYLDENYNPENIRKEMREAAKSDPETEKMLQQAEKAEQAEKEASK